MLGRYIVYLIWVMTVYVGFDEGEHLSRKLWVSREGSSHIHSCGLGAALGSALCAIAEGDLGLEKRSIPVCSPELLSDTGLSMLWLVFFSLSSRQV